MTAQEQTKYLCFFALVLFLIVLLPVKPARSREAHVNIQAIHSCSWCITPSPEKPLGYGVPAPPPPCRSHPLSFPRGGGWGTVTWSTQNFSLRLIVLLYG